MTVWHMCIACWTPKATNVHFGCRPQMTVWHMCIACWIPKATNIHFGCRPQMTVWHMCIACWIPKATNIHFGCVIPFALPVQEWLHECATVLRYMYIACLVTFINKIVYNCCRCYI